MRHILTLCVLAFALFVFAAPVFADDPITVTSNKYTNNFPTKLVFQLDAQSNGGKIAQVTFFAQLDGQAASSRYIPEFTPDGKIRATYEWKMIQNYIPPGVSGQYWWTIEDDAGNKKQIDKQSFRVDDPTRQWMKLANDKLALYWHAGGDSFGKAVYDRAVQAMGQLEKDTGVIVDRQVQIYVYGDRNDFLKALGPSARGIEGGVTFGDYGVVLMEFAPAELEWGKGATTHEMTHVIIHAKIRGPLGDLSMPKWMDEGLAMYYETFPGSLDPQFAVPLRDAIRNDRLVPIRSFSTGFPNTWAEGNLAYGEGYSVVDFIFRKYGREKMAQLLQEFKKGGYYDDILKKVLGVDTDGLDNEWRKDIGAKPRVIATRSSATATPFPTLSLSTDATSTPQSVAVKTTPVLPAPTTSPRAQGNPLSQLCGGALGFIAFAVLGVVWYQRRVCA